MDALSGLGMPSIDVPLVSATAAQLMELSDKLKAKGEELKAKGEELLRTSDIIDSLAVTRGDIENIEAIEARE